MECHLSTTLALCAVAPPRCGAADVRVLGTVQQNTSTASVYLILNLNELMMTLYSIFQDWPRHRAECIPAMSPTSCYNVNMIATPPPAEPQFVNVSAILFSPEEGELTEVINCFRLSNASASRKTEDCYY